MIACVLPAFAGFVVQYAGKQVGLKLAFYYMLTSFVATISLTFGSVGVNVAGYTKKVSIGAMIFIACAYPILSDPIPPPFSDPPATLDLQTRAATSGDPSSSSPARPLPTEPACSPR